MAAESNDKGAGAKRWVRVLLVVSLALNLLFIGSIAGAMLTHSKWRSHHPPRLDMAAGPLTQALSREDRRAIGREMRKAYRSAGANRADLQAGFEALIADLKQEPFDPEVVAKHLERHRGVFDERLALGQTLLLERLTQMQPDERADYAARLLDALQQRKHWKGHRD